LILHEATVATALVDPVDVAFKKRLALPYQMTTNGRNTTLIDGVNGRASIPKVFVTFPTAHTSLMILPMPTT